MPATVDLDKVKDTLLGKPGQEDNPSPLWVAYPDGTHIAVIREISSDEVLGTGSCQVFLALDLKDFGYAFHPPVMDVLSVLGYLEEDSDVFFLMSCRDSRHLSDAGQRMARDFPEVPLTIFDPHSEEKERFLTDIRNFSGFYTLETGEANDRYLSQFSEAALARSAIALAMNGFLPEKTLSYPEIVMLPPETMKRHLGELSGQIGKRSRGRCSFPEEECSEILDIAVDGGDLAKLSRVVPRFRDDGLAGEIMSIMDCSRDYHLAFTQLLSYIGLRGPADSSGWGEGLPEDPDRFIWGILDSMGILEKVDGLVLRHRREGAGISDGIREILAESDRTAGYPEDGTMISLPYPPFPDPVLTEGAKKVRDRLLEKGTTREAGRSYGYHSSFLSDGRKDHGFSLMIIDPLQHKEFRGDDAVLPPIGVIEAALQLLGYIEPGFGAIMVNDTASVRKCKPDIESLLENGECRVVYDDSGMFDSPRDEILSAIGTRDIGRDMIGYTLTEEPAPEMLAMFDGYLRIWACRKLMEERGLAHSGAGWSRYQVGWTRFAMMSMGLSPLSMEDSPCGCDLLSLGGIMDVPLSLLGNSGYAQEERWRAFMREFHDMERIWEGVLAERQLQLWAGYDCGYAVLGKIGYELGVDKAVEAYYSGVTVEDIVGR